MTQADMMRVNVRQAATPTIGLACMARPTFAVDYASEAAVRALGALRDLGWPVVGDAMLLMDAAAAQQARQALAQRNPDLLVILCATFSDASMAVELTAGLDTPVCLWALREPGPVGDRLWLNSLCGANITSHALQREGHHVRYVYGDPDEPEVLRTISALARAAATRARLRQSRIGLIGQAPTGFYGCEFDTLELARVVGVSVSQLDLGSVFATARETAADAVAGAIESTAQRSPSLRALDATHVERFGQTYVTLRDVAQVRALDGLAVRCWPEFPQDFGVMPCATLGRLADDGYVTACEADMHGAVTLLLLQWLSGAAPLLADLVAMDHESDSVSLWHCGNAPACLAREGEEPRLTVHCNRRIGVAGDFAIGPGPATLARLGVGPDGYRLLHVEGEVIDRAVNRFAGNTAVFHPNSGAAPLLDTIMQRGWEHHVAFVSGHLSFELAALAQFLEIESITL